MGKEEMNVKMNFIITGLDESDNKELTKHQLAIKGLYEDVRTAEEKLYARICTILYPFGKLKEKKR